MGIFCSAVVTLMVFFFRSESSPSLSLREQWEATPFHLDEQERKRLLAIPVVFRPSIVGSSKDPNEPLPVPYSRGGGQSRGAVVAREMVPELQRRANQKVIVTREEFLQIYQAYSNQGHPVFITTDSILNAFHFVFEDSFLGLEFTLAAKLPALLSQMRVRLSKIESEGDGEIIELATRRAKIVLAVAHRLIDPEAKLGDDREIASLVVQEVRRVEQAQGRWMPSWLGASAPWFRGMDYSHFRPLSFYTRSEKLKRYFRAVRWLQTIPFHVQRDHELLAMLQIARTAEQTGWADFAASYHEFFGEVDDWDVAVAAKALGSATIDAAQIESIRKKLLGRLETEPRPGMIHDFVRDPDWDQADPQAQALNFRILSGYRLPESVLFGKTTDESPFRPRLPSGLEVCAALGSEFARRNLPASHRELLLPVIDAHRELFEGKSLYAEYLACLSTLVADPPANAPEFMKSEPWQTKSCQTVLAGWVQARHTLALHAKKHSNPPNGGESFARGFVEPNPEFFRRLARLTERVEESLRRAGAFQFNCGRLELELREFIRIVKFLMSQNGQKARSEQDKEFVNTLRSRLYSVGIFFWAVPTKKSYGLESILVPLVHLLDAVERGELPDDPHAVAALRQLEFPLETRWQKLTEMCLRLEQLAEKQLKEEDFSDDDNEFITHYGDDLSALLLYEVLAAYHPRDDALRAADVLTTASGSHFHVAVGRPRAIYVLYPHKGKEVLCRGAVLPYYEFTHPTPLTDDEWKALHDSPQRPERQPWLKPLYAP